jgi:hypothetical protein
MGRSRSAIGNRKGLRTMKKMLAMLILGAWIALPAARAFAAEGGCHHGNYPVVGQNPGVTLGTEPATPANPPAGP